VILTILKSLLELIGVFLFMFFIWIVLPFGVVLIAVIL